MRVSFFLPATLLLITATAACFALTPVIHTARTKAHTAAQQSNIKHASTRTAALHKSVRTAPVAARHESIGIPSERAAEIQTALIQHGYLTGEPSGVWDSQTAAAMEKLQSENGWQTKIMPDSRALIKLGLGPTSTTAPAASPQ